MTTEFKIFVIRNGARFKEILIDENDPPSVTISKDAEIHCSMQGSFDYDEGIDYLKDELQLVSVINGNEMPIAVFTIASASKETFEGHSKIRLECYDRALVLHNNRCDTLLFVEKGTNYIAAIRSMLSKCGITRVYATPTSNVLQTAREYGLGNDFLSICNELLSEINYDSIFFDGDGVCVLRPHTGPSADNIKWRYGDNELFTIEQHTQDDYVESDDIYDAPNVFVCTCANPEMDADMVAVSVNQNPASRKSTFSRGMRIVRVVPLDNIASQAELQAYADRIRNESLWSNRTLTFSSLYDGNHGVGDTIAISNEAISGIYVEETVDFQLNENPMVRHTARKAVMA